MKQSKHLTEFYKSYLLWVEMGTQDVRMHSTRYGLCTNLSIYCRHFDLPELRLGAEMIDQFEEAGLNYSVPFNDEDLGEPSYACEGRNHHLNEKRMAWVREHANG